MKPVRLELLIDDKTLKGIMSAEGNLDNLTKYAQGTIALLTKELKAMQKEYDEAVSKGVANNAKLAEIQALTGKIKELEAGLESLSATQSEVASKPMTSDAAERKMKNLQMSMTQIARELPSLAVGPQMFFLAISNNIPVLADAIKDAREEYARTMATVGKGTPVWKQVLSSIVNWQTLLAVGVTLLVMYGDEIADWVTSLFKGKEAATSLAEATKKINENLQENSKGLAEQVTRVKSLADRWKELGGDLEKQRKFLKDNRDELDKTGLAINSVNDAETLLVKGTDTYVKAMALRAKAAEAFNLAVEAEQKKMEKTSKLQQRKQEGPGFLQNNRWLLGAAGYLFIDDYKDEIKGINNEIKDADTVFQNYLGKFGKYSKEADELLKKLGLKETGSGKGGSTKNYAEMLAEARVEADRKAERARIAVMQESVEKRKALAIQEHKEEIARINKEEKEQLELLKNARKSGQKVSPTAGNEIANTAAVARAAANEQLLRSVAAAEKEWQEAGIQAWIEYNKQYGTAQEKRLAITQDYTRRIAEAQHEGEKASLQAAMKEEIREVNMQELTDSIDFADVFARLDQQTTEALEQLRDKLREYIKSMQGDLNATDLKTLQDALNRITRTISGRKPAASLKESYDALVAAQKEVAEAQENVKTAQEKGEVVVQKYDHATGELTTEVLTLAQAEEKLNSAQNKRKKAMGDLAEGAVAVAGEMRNVSNAANSIVGSLESLGVTVDSDVQGVVDGFTQATEGGEEFVQAFVSGNVVGMISGAMKNIAGNIKMIGSLFGADWGGEKSRQAYEKAKEKYENYMAVLDKVIDKQKELVGSMEADDYANAQNSYERAKGLLAESIDYARAMGKEYLNSGASKGFLGINSSASQGVKQREGLSNEAWAQAYKVLGEEYRDVLSGRMASLFDLPTEKLRQLRDEATGFYAELHEDTREYIDDILEAADALEEVEDARRESLTKTSLDDFKNSYLDLMADLDATNEDFAKNFEKYLQRALIESLFNEKYKEQYERLYKQWADASESGGGLDSTEAAELKNLLDEINREAIAQRDEMAKVFGWDSYSSQSGRAGSAINITEEQAGRLEGIGNAMLDHVVTIDDTAHEIGDSLAGAASSLAIIAENSQHLKRLDEIADNIQAMNFGGVKIKN